MDTFHVFSRIFAIVFGYCLACLAASLFLAFTIDRWSPGSWVLQNWWIGYDGFIHYETLPRDTLDAADTMMRIVVGLLGASVVGALAFVPAGLAIVAAEIFRLRSLLYHLIAAGIVALAILAGTFVPQFGPARLPDDWNMFLAAGFVGGLVYWLIAGRGSGFTIPRERIR